MNPLPSNFIRYSAQKRTFYKLTLTMLKATLSALSTSLAKPEEMGILIKDENTQYKLSHPFISISGSTKENGECKERSFSLSLKDLMTIGEQIGNIHSISFDDSDKLDDDTPVRVSVISRAVALSAGEGFMVFAGV